MTSGVLVVGGGKGANQAVAAARLGADVTFVGAVGDDDYGRRMLETLRQDGINTGFVRRIRETATGTALAGPLPDELLRNVHIMTPNETETTVLTGMEVTDVASAEETARALLDIGVDAAVIQMGELGAFLLDGGADGPVLATEGEVLRQVQNG